MSSTVDTLCVNTIRVLAADMVQAANSGHPGAPMGLAPTGHALFTKVLKASAKNPKWWNRDRFVLSNGHACSLQYVLLHLCGYDVTLDDLKAFRQLGSKCPGHPESFRTPGVEVTTGPLGQGIANAVGFAMAQQHLAAVYNKPGFELFTNDTYAICGDGCLQEGVAAEAVSLAGTLKLGKLTLLYDDNKIQIDGETDLAFTDDTPARFESMGWHVVTVTDGDHDVDGIVAAIAAAKAVTDKPSLVVIKTTIGFAAAKQGTEAVHGAPLGAADLANVKTKLGFNSNEFFVVPEEVRAHYAAAAATGAAAEAAWNELYAAYTAAHPTEAAELARRMSGALPVDWESLLPVYAAGAKADATRNTSGVVLNALAPKLVELMGGSADLTPSNKTELKCSNDFSAANRAGRYIRFGVREHAMAAIGNGLAAYGGFIPFTATFLNFIEYAYGAVRLSALSGHKQVYIMTHDSIGLGEDGPTHQPIEALTLLRATPDLLTLRPADGNEVAGSYAVALQFNGPSVLALSRQNLPSIPGSSAAKVLRGAYTVEGHEKTAAAGAGAAGAVPLVFVATGSEVEVALAAAAVAVKSEAFSSVSVVSAPCLELFDQQPACYRASVLPPGAFVVSVEAASVTGWERYAHASVGMESFGESAPTPALYKHFGFTGEAVAARAVEEAAAYTAAVATVASGVAPVRAAFAPVPKHGFSGVPAVKSE